MSVIHYLRHLYYCTVAVALILLLGSCQLRAQTKQLLAWQEDLSSLQNASGDERVQNQPAIQQIRNGMEFYLKFHPSSKAVLPTAPSQPGGIVEMRSHVAALRKTLEVIMKEDPIGRRFTQNQRKESTHVSFA